MPSSKPDIVSTAGFWIDLFIIGLGTLLRGSVAACGQHTRSSSTNSSLVPVNEHRMVGRVGFRQQQGWPIGLVC